MTTRDVPRTRTNRWFAAACVVGVVHAVPSLYWAAGGDLLLATVGEWAVRWRLKSPVGSAVALAGAGLAKIVGAVVPLLFGSRAPVRLRVLVWVAAVGLLVWGVVNAVGAGLVLVGLFPIRDPAGTWGHAVLWDPLFALWGILLIIGLRRAGAARG